MAITESFPTGNGTTGPYTFNFEYLNAADVKVSVNGSSVTAFSLPSKYEILFTSLTPSASDVIRIYRQTDDSELSATFYPGSAIRSQDLNDNFTQNLYVTQEVNNNAVKTDGSNTMVGDLDMGGYKIINLQTPAADTNAATKGYVDSKVGASGPPGYTNWSYTATGGETVVGTSGAILEYQTGKEQVYLNGALLKLGTDYTATDGRTVSITPALTAGDILQIRCVNYLAADPTASYDYSRWTYTATGGETSLSGGLTYTVNREQVFLNGALLQRGTDYSAVNGTSISILSGALLAGDMVEVHSNNSI